MKARTGSLLAILFLMACSSQLPQLRSDVQPRTDTLGAFAFEWSANQAFTVRGPGGQILLESLPGVAFVSGFQGKADFHESRGMFFIKESKEKECQTQLLERIEAGPDRYALSGELLCAAEKSAYTLEFFVESDQRLGFELNLAGPLNRAMLIAASVPEEGFFGFGEQFTYFNQKGRLLPIFVMEQGIGRGAEPITTGADLTADAGGKWHTSYAGVPHFLSSRMRSLFLENYEYSVFDMRPANHLSIYVLSAQMRGQLLAGKDPLELTRAYTEATGRMRALPDWVHSGAIVGMQGGTEKVRRVLSLLKEHNTPIAAFWLQDWVGQRKTTFGKQLWWNWQLDRQHYPGWEDLRQTLGKDGIRVLLYINPFLADIAEKGSQERNLYPEALAAGCLVRKADGKPYLILNTSFSAGLLDLSAPACREWIKGIIKTEMIAQGASGWMADFGEALPMDSVLQNGDPATYHNRYPEEWARVNREAINEAGRGQDIVFFMRAGFTRSPQNSTLFWLGDQLVSWDRYDGIKTAVTGLLTGGLSGYTLNHSDIGGYTTINNPLKNYHRSEELLLRWAELSAFNAIFRTHEGNRPDENVQVYSNERTLSHFARFARIFAALAPYRQLLIEEAARDGHPVVRPMFFHYPGEKAFHHIDSEQFMLGPDIIMAPVLDPGRSHVRLHLPEGEWVHFFSGKIYRSRSQTFSVSAPIGSPAVFYRQESAFAELFARSKD